MKKKELFIEEILKMELLQIKKNADKYLGKGIKDIIIGVPNSFNFFQRQLIKEVATNCELNCIRVIGESNLASLLYTFNQSNYKNEENILIFDLGAGFLNISVIALEDLLIEVKSVSGLSNIGGDDFDNRLIEYCINEFKSKKGVDIIKNPKALIRLRKECEKAKKILSSATKTFIELYELMSGEDLIIEITRDKFEDLCIDLFQKCLLPIETALKDSEMNKYQINTIILSGGSSRIPKIQTMIKEYFDGNHIIKQLNSDEIVSSGAAIQAAIMSNIRHTKIENLSFLDVLPHSIGIEIEGGVMNVIVPRAMNIPCKKTIIVFTCVDNQFEILFKVYEGEGQLTKDNLLIDKINFGGLPPGPKGHILVEVTLDIDANFNLCFLAVEKITGKYKNKNICYTRNKQTVTVQFISTDQNINYSISCSNFDIF